MDREAARFWSRVDVGRGWPGPCWEWRGARQKDALGVERYGVFRRADGKLVLAHRYAHESFHGPIAEGMNVLHRCDNTGCCNPFHTFEGTQQENLQDAAAKGRIRNQFSPPLEVVA